MDEPVFLFAGGGTGGHLFPGIAVAEELRERFPRARLVFVGTDRRVEQTILQSHRLEHVSLDSPPSTLLRRRPFRFAWKFLRACHAAKTLVRNLQPTAVIGLGGFASVPVVQAASRRRVSIVLLEQNAVPGRATSRLQRHATVVCHAFPQAVPRGRHSRNTVVTGNPVRREVTQLIHSSDRQTPATRTLLILGGSQGSTFVNETMLVAAEQLQPLFKNWRIVHQCGSHNTEEIRQRYQKLHIEHVVQPFFDDLPRYVAAADIAVSRAGATTLAELACAAVPAILIPYPNSVRNHQQRNAEAYANCGAAVIVEQAGSAPDCGPTLATKLKTLLTEPAARESAGNAMRSLARPDAARCVAEIILEVAQRNAADMPPIARPHFADVTPEPLMQRERTP